MADDEQAPEEPEDFNDDVDEEPEDLAEEPLEDELDDDGGRRHPVSRSRPVSTSSGTSRGASSRKPTGA